MRIKRSLKVVALVLAALLFFPSAALAALPSNTIVFGTKAYDLSLLDDASLANGILAAFVANGNLFAYKMPAGNFIDANAQAIDPATLPAVTYVDAAKVSTNYQAGDGDVVPTAVTLTGVNPTMSVQAGQTAQITATAVPADATVTYASSNEAKATVSGTGLVTGVEAGTANITVTAAKTGMTSATATVAVTVTALPTVAVTVGSPTMSLTVGAIGTIVATPTPSDATVTFESDTPAIATVDPTTGVVTAVAVGTATITVTAAKTDYTSGTATVDVTVTDIVAPAITEAEFVDYQTLKVTFTEEVVESEAGLVVTFNDVEVDAVLADDGMSLTIVDEDGFAAGVYTGVVNGLEDLAGNAMEADATVTITKAASVIDTLVFTSTGLKVSSSDLYFELYDQYGQKYTTVDANAITVKASYASAPVDEAKNDEDEFCVTLDSAMNLTEGRSIVVKGYKTVSGGLVEIGSATLFVSDAAPVATSISKVVTTATDLKPGDTNVTWSATVLDQYNNPVDSLGADTLRWETSDKSVVAFTSASGDATKDWADGDTGSLEMAFDLKAEGQATITAWVPDLTASASATVVVGKGVLTGIVTDDANITVNNKKPVTASNVKVNDAEADNYILFKNAKDANIPVLADSLTFTVTALTGFAVDDITMEKVVDAGYLTGLKVSSNRTALSDDEKAGDYLAGVDYTVKVSSDVEDVADQTFTVKSTIDAAVASISDITVAANELPAGQSVDKAVSFYNKYGEALNISKSAVTLTASHAALTLTALVDDTDIVTGVRFGATAAGTYTAMIVSGAITRTVGVPVVAEAKVKSIEIPSTVSVIKADAYDPTDPATIVMDGEKAYKGVPVKFVDQYGNYMDVAYGDGSNVACVGTNLDFIQLKKLDADGYAMATGTDVVVAIGVHAVEGAAASVVFTVDVATGLKATGYSGATVTATVTAARALEALSVDKPSQQTTVGGSATYTFSGEDQHGAPFVLVAANVTVSEGTAKYTVDTTEQGEDDDVAKVKVTLTGVSASANTVTVSYTDTLVKTTIAFVVAEPEGIASVAIQPVVNVAPEGTDVYDVDLTEYKAKVTADDTTDTNVYTFTVKAFDDGDEIGYGADDIFMTVVSNTLKANGAALDPESLLEFGTDEGWNELTLNPVSTGVISGTVTVRATSVNGKTDEMVITFDSGDAALQDGGYYVAKDTAGTEPLTAIVIDNTNEYTEAGVSTVYLVGTDQYGQVSTGSIDIIGTGRDSTAYFGVTSYTEGALVLTGKKAGTTNLRIFIDANNTVVIPVTVVDVPVG